MTMKKTNPNLEVLETAANDYLVILSMGRDVKIPVTVSATTTIDALEKVVCFCKKEGYFALSLDCVQIKKDVGIINI